MLKTEFEKAVQEVLDQELEDEITQKKIDEVVKILVERVESDFGLDADDELMKDDDEEDDGI